MTWTAQQIQDAQAAARRARLDERGMARVLRIMPRSLYDAGGRPTTLPSIKSPFLDDSDFAFFMATLEHETRGRLDGFERGHWARVLAVQADALRGEIERVLALLVQAGEFSKASLPQWIKDRTSGRATALRDCDFQELDRMMLALKMLARKRNIAID